jgi:hypothetical protein
MVLREVPMKSYAVLIALVATFVAINTAPGFAQQAGFRAGIAHGPVGLLPPGFPVGSMSTFTVAPRHFLPVQPWTPFGLVPTFPTVVIPNTVLVPNNVLLPSPGYFPGQTFVPNYPGQSYYPGQAVIPVVPPVPVIVPPGVVHGGVPFVPHGHRFVPTAGTPRGDVIRQLGAPSVTVITNSGETLYFTGGVTVIIQNGQVVGPR